MKILFLANGELQVYNTRLELIKELLSKGHKVALCFPYSDRVKELTELGCEFIDVKIDRHGKNPFNDLKLLKFYKKTIKEVKPDVVFTFTIKCNIYGAIACRKFNLPCIANITGLGTAVEDKGILQTLTVLMYKFAFKKIKTVFFQNFENMAFFEKHKIALNKHKLLPGSGVNLDKFKVIEYPNDEQVNFGFVARVMKQKGIDEYLESAKALKEKYPNAVFHVCGGKEKEYVGELDELNEKGVVVYHGKVSDMTELYAKLHCVVLPTYYPEGMANVLLESLATGRPIITTDRAGCREIADNEVNGYIVKQKDSQDLTEKMEKFLLLSNEERRVMGLNGRAKVEKEFDRKIVIKKYMNELGGNNE